MAALIPGSFFSIGTKSPWISQISLTTTRSKSYFRTLDQNTLWKTNTSIGYGKLGMDWPGLTSDITQRSSDTNLRSKNTIKEMSEGAYDEYKEKLKEKRLQMTSGRKRKRVFASSKRLDGRKQPRNSSTLVVTGNKDGLAGFALYKIPALNKSVNAVQRAVDKAGKKLTYIPRYEDRTVYHDFFTRFGATKIFVKQKPPGHGIKSQRIIKAICEVVGIKDLYAKIEGSINPQHIVKAFFIGLIRQRTHQDLANEKRLHLVEFREENENFPRLVATPEGSSVRTKAEILPNEILDFEMISFEGHMPYYRPTPAPFYTRLPGWETHLKRNEPYQRNKERMIQMFVDHGEIRSHLTDKYSECTNSTQTRKYEVD
ncbi:RP-S5 [Lepeophtheirus salmonis]|uniref:RP-S5 n=1 Tax=Lepeophtheirus salmonis TaxID=72036 RepID=A0A7R8CUU1_LEPSM|nr:RP-S5 [Lepeophtheirus salmonis]CAF2937537.1 RP-S5 [Lepeophtheirus salmonis]